MDRLKGKVVVITGGARGVGYCMCERFAQENPEVIYSIDMADGGYAHPLVRPVKLSITDRTSLAAFALQVREEFGHVDVLVNNAAITRDSMLYKMTEEQWDAVIDVNLKGTFNITQALVPFMREQKKGCILSISSGSGVYGNIGQTNYAATKAGLIGMTYSWAKELNLHGEQIRCNVLAPDNIETEMAKTIPAKILDPLIARTPLGRMCQPIEVANTALFLASEEASFINGQVVCVNGGLRL
ncbi:MULTISPECIES: SDR family oxidoreductase [unclassified Oscillibacter]|uniref:SDR family oxidoreductase n=1 Tax=unclassified Oscillibacter TaxID=2629304 RepID=UPI0025ED81F7|nr:MULTISPECIES: SDR family oxidoreductase [unclassified Oscillibacter]